MGPRESDPRLGSRAAVHPGSRVTVGGRAVVDGQEVETNEQAEKKGKKKRGFLSRFFDL